MTKTYDYLFKAVVCGDDGVGKTTLGNHLAKPVHNEHKMTIGVGFHVNMIELDTEDGPILCKLQLFVISSKKQFKSIRSNYYRGSNGAILIFDLTNPLSFEHLPEWINEIRENMRYKIPIILVGNKSDLISNRLVSTEDIDYLIKAYNIPVSFIVSAKLGINVNQVFEELLKKILQEKEKAEFNAFIDELKYYDSKFKEEPKKISKICPNCGAKAYSGQHYCKVCNYKFI